MVYCSPMSKSWEGQPVEHSPCATDEITHVYVVPGWTLGPEDGWYGTTTTQLEAITGVDTAILPGVPTPDEPDPEQWQNSLDAAITHPRNSLVIAHSLGTITAIKWAARQSDRDPLFRLGGLVVVAGNLTDVGFPEITRHFPPPNEIIRQASALKNHVLYQPELFYGRYDPFVSLDHGRLLARILDAQITIGLHHGHFSGSFYDEELDSMMPEEIDYRPDQAKAAYEITQLFNEHANGQWPLMDPEQAAHKMLHRPIPRQLLPGSLITQRAAAIVLCSKAAARNTPQSI